jgi:hypothetical protein
MGSFFFTVLLKTTKERIFCDCSPKCFIIIIIILQHITHMTIHRKQGRQITAMSLAVENDKLGGSLMRRNQCVSVVGPPHHHHHHHHQWSCILYTSTLTPIILASRKELFPPSVAADPLYPPVHDEPDREPHF